MDGRRVRMRASAAWSCEDRGLREHEAVSVSEYNSQTLLPNETKPPVPRMFLVGFRILVLRALTLSPP